MPCIQTLSGLARDCSSNMGGILEVLIANSADVTGVTISEGIISTISMAAYYSMSWHPPPAIMI